MADKYDYVEVKATAVNTTHYFFSGKCYRKGTDHCVRRFDGITIQLHEGDAEPISARSQVISEQTKLCHAAGFDSVYVHIEQMNAL